MVGNALSHRDFGQASAIQRCQQIRTKRTRRGICPGTVPDRISQRSQLFSHLRLLHRSGASDASRRMASFPHSLNRSTDMRGVSRRRRKIDLRRIRVRVCYFVPEAAALLRVTEGTIRTWLRAGLPALDRNRPTLILGADLKAWLQGRQISRRHKCGPDELFCLRCRRPRTLRPNSREFIEKNPKRLMIRGKCSTCDTVMHKVASRANAAEARSVFCPAEASKEPSSVQ
jgi:hypothetical protein